MKNAAVYEKKIRKLLAGMARAQAGDPPRGAEAIATMIEAILQANATRKQAKDALDAIGREFVDFNELRVSPPKDVVDCIGRDHPGGRAKAEMTTSVLQNIYAKAYDVSMDHMGAMTKRDLRAHLEELGLGPYASACVVLQVFGGHAVPVDEDLVESLKMKRLIHPDSGLADVQGFLTRVIPQSDALSAHEFFRSFVAKSAKELAKKRKADAQARLKAQVQAQAKAEAEARAQAQEQAKARQSAKQAKQAAKKAAKKTPKAQKSSSRSKKPAGPASPRKKAGRSSRKRASRSG